MVMSFFVHTVRKQFARKNNSASFSKTKWRQKKSINKWPWNYSIQLVQHNPTQFFCLFSNRLHLKANTLQSNVLFLNTTGTWSTFCWSNIGLLIVNCIKWVFMGIFPLVNMYSWSVLRLSMINRSINENV